MGNWRTVWIIGEISKDEVNALREVCTPKADYSNFHCLSICDGLCGFGDWVDGHINVSGNLAERDYTVEDVANQLKKLVKVAPSMSLKVHCGGDYEDEKCIATITVKNGQVDVGSPEVEWVKGVSEDEIRGRVFRAIIKR